MRTGLIRSASDVNPTALMPATELFRARFQRAMRHCVRRRFSVAECFGVIWLETLEEITLDDEEQAELYEELIGWAKRALFAEVLHGNSPQLFTAAGARAQDWLED